MVNIMRDALTRSEARREVRSYRRRVGEDDAFTASLEWRLEKLTDR
jgi:hypothetical protein